MAVGGGDTAAAASSGAVPREAKSEAVLIMTTSVIQVITAMIGHDYKMASWGEGGRLVGKVGDDNGE